MPIDLMKRLIKRQLMSFSSRLKFLTNHIFGQYRYTYAKDWFYQSELHNFAEKFLKNHSNNPIDLLEIGSFEGLSTTFLIDSFLYNPDSRITCIDPFMLYEENDHISLMAHQQVENFFYNISKSNFPEKVRYMGITSDEFFKFNNSKYHFIYLKI